MTKVIDPDHLNLFSFSFDEEAKKINTTRGVLTYQINETDKSYLDITLQDTSVERINLNNAIAPKTIDRYKVPNQENWANFTYSINTSDTNKNFSSTSYLSGDIIVVFKESDTSKKVPYSFTYTAALGNFLIKTVIRTETKNSNVTFTVDSVGDHINFTFTENTENLKVDEIYYRGHGL